MARARTLVLDTRVNVAGEEKLTGLSNRLESAGTRIKNAFSPGNLLAVAGIGVGVAQITSFLGDAIDAASDLQETISKTGQVLGEEALPGLEEWAKGAADAFGQSERVALDAASSFAIFGKSAGLVGDDLVGFSTGLTELSADFASFFNTSPEEAITAIGAALRGESEPIRRYGILLDDATLRQRAFSLGITDSIRDALTPQQRVLAAQAEIMAQSSDAQGDFARTSEGLANQQRKLQARLENVSAEVGEKLLPVMVDLVSFVSDVGIPVMREFIDLLDFGDVNSAEGIFGLEQIEDALNGASDAGTRLNDMLTGREGDIGAAAEQIGTDYETMRVRVLRTMDNFDIGHKEAIDRIVNGLDAIPETISATVLASTAAWKERDIGQAAEEAAQGIPEAFEEAQAEAEKIVRKTPGALADQLRAGIEDYDKALEELTEVAVNSVSDLAERQKIEGILASQELTDALNSDSTRTRLLAQDLVSDLVSDYELIAPGALRAGQLVNPNLSAGLESNVSLTRRAADAIRNAASQPLVDLGPAAYGWGATLSSNFLSGMSSYYSAIRDTSIRLGDAAATGIRLRSPAEAGALAEPADHWGRQLGEMFAEGMRQSVSGISAASLAMGDAAVPSLGIDLARSTSSGLSPVAGGAVTNNFYLQWDGEPPQGRTEAEIIAVLQRLLPLSMSSTLTGI
jgi:hypothetical protein